MTSRESTSVGKQRIVRFSIFINVKSRFFFLDALGRLYDTNVPPFHIETLLLANEFIILAEYGRSRNVSNLPKQSIRCLLGWYSSIRVVYRESNGFIEFEGFNDLAQVPG